MEKWITDTKKDLGKLSEVIGVSKWRFRRLLSIPLAEYRSKDIKEARSEAREGSEAKYATLKIG